MTEGQKNQVRRQGRSEGQLVLKAEASKFEMFVNGVKFAGFRFRGRSHEAVSHLVIRGNVEVNKLIYTSR